jgi:hypothetical protein
MEFLPVSRTTSGVQIESIPDGVKVVQLGGPKAQRLADLGLHRADLQFAHDALEALNTSALSKFHREALWRSAIVHFFKCFSTNEARFSLAPQSVYKGEPPEALENFTYFKDLRNKHLGVTSRKGPLRTLRVADRYQAGHDPLRSHRERKVWEIGKIGT